MLGHSSTFQDHISDYPWLLYHMNTTVYHTGPVSSNSLFEDNKQQIPDLWQGQLILNKINSK